MTFTELITQTLGFLLQTLPLAILYPVSFEAEALPASRKGFSLFMTAVLLCMSAGFTLLVRLLYHPTGANNFIMRTATNLYVCACIVLFAIIFFVFIRTAFIKKALVLVLLIHYAAILFTLASILNGIFQVNRNYVMVIYDYFALLSYLGEYLITLPLIYLFLKKIVKPSLPVMESPSLRRGFFYLTSALLLYCACIFILTNFTYYFGIKRYPVLFYILAFIITDSILYFMFFAEVRLSAKNRELTEQIKSFDEKYRQISANVAESRRARHDIRHHLNIIGALHREGKEDELSEYLEQYEAFCQELEKMPLSGFSSLDSILRYYIQRAREEEIAVRTDLQPLPATLPFDVIDLTVLVGNLMENAIEACRQIPQEDAPFLSIWLRLENVSLLMQIENACLYSNHGPSEFSDGKEFFSVKSAALRGQGLKSIRYIAEKYGGSAEFKKDGGTFCARIVLNIPAR